VKKKLRAILPWLSLLLGLASAIWMNRKPERAPVIALAASGGWLLLAALAILESATTKAARAARLGAALGSQSLVQLCLFFSAPFYLRAAAIPSHYVFVAIVGLAGAITLWTPLSEALIRHPVLGAALFGVATFAGLDCVLPLLGFSNRVSLWIAVGWTAAGLPLLALVRQTKILAPLAVAIAIVIGFFAGGARFIPPAPLRFVEGEMGTRVSDRRVLDPSTNFEKIPDQLVCFTAIFAPRGLRDHLRHVWRQNGSWRGDVALEVRGGRPQGFRTWSTHRGLTPGNWSCTVETESGQRLGRVKVHVGP
jgi:hypothetical protein